MSAKSANRLIDHLMSGLEDIMGVWNGKNSLRERLAASTFLSLSLFC